MINTTQKILIVEDDRHIREMMRIALKSEGYICQVASDGEIAIQYIDEHNYDLILLDVMLPKFNGYEVLTYIKEKDIPAIFISAKKEISERIKGLDLGADDYITKPFDMLEMLARVKAVLRRCSSCEEVLCYGDIILNFSTRKVMKACNEVILTLKEFELLALLIRNEGIAVHREQLFHKIWNEPYDYASRTLDLHIQKIRKKLDLHNQIKTVHKIGYMLVHDEN